MNIPTFTHGIRGEYRAVLKDFRGRIKYDSGWKPNMVLDQGPWKYLSETINTMSLGTSATAVVSTQTGIQGSFLAAKGMNDGPVVSEWVTPPYWVSAQANAAFTPGEGTGTINEFVLNHGGLATNAINDAAIRVVLDAPIVKGGSDYLTIEHRLYVYPDVTTKTGVLNISGVDYDYEMGWYNIDGMLSGFDNSTGDGLINVFTNGGKINFGNPVTVFYINGVMPVDIFSPPSGDTGPGGWQANASSAAVNGTPPTQNHNLYSGVDYSNGSFDMWKIYCNPYAFGVYDAGRVVKLTRTSDGAPFLKENTHHMGFTWQTSVDKYIP